MRQVAFRERRPGTQDGEVASGAGHRRRRVEERGLADARLASDQQAAATTRADAPEERRDDPEFGLPTEDLTGHGASVSARWGGSGTIFVRGMDKVAGGRYSRP